MKRIVPLVVLTLLALAAALAWFSSDRDPTGLETAIAVERRLQTGDFLGAKAEIEATRGRIPAWRTDYLESIVCFSERKIPESLAAAKRALAAAPDDWRSVSMVFHASVQAGRPAEGWTALDAYLRAHPDDERALVAAAQYWMGVAPGGVDVERAAGYVERIERLATRTAPPGDPTAVSHARLESLRASVASLRGRIHEGLAAAREAASRSPQDPEAHARLADLQRRTGDVAGAVASWKEAVRLAPTEPLYLEQFTLVLLEVGGGGAEALAAARRLGEMRPSDPGPKVLQARALVRLDRIPEAADLYRSLLKEDLPAERRREVLRNLAVALYDWSAGGVEGPYLDEAHVLLAEYVRLGGEIDERIGDTWSRLQERARKQGQ